MVGEIQEPAATSHGMSPAVWGVVMRLRVPACVNVTSRCCSEEEGAHGERH